MDSHGADTKTTLSLSDITPIYISSAAFLLFAFKPASLSVYVSSPAYEPAACIQRFLICPCFFSWQLPEDEEKQNALTSSEDGRRLSGTKNILLHSRAFTDYGGDTSDLLFFLDHPGEAMAD